MGAKKKPLLVTATLTRVSSLILFYPQVATATQLYSFICKKMRFLNFLTRMIRTALQLDLDLD
jgi:hypothetical protein